MRFVDVFMMMIMMVDACAKHTQSALYSPLSDFRSVTQYRGVLTNVSTRSRAGSMRHELCTAV